MLLCELLRSLGRRIGRQPWPFVLVPLCLVLLCCLGLPFMREDSDTWELFAPDDAPCRAEQAALAPFPSLSGDSHETLSVLVHRSDGAGLAHSAVLAVVVAFNRAVEEETRLELSETLSLSFADLCGDLCGLRNGPLLGELARVLPDPGALANFSRIHRGRLMGSLGGKVLTSDASIVQFHTLILRYHLRRLNGSLGRRISASFDAELRRLAKLFSSKDLQLSAFTPRLDAESQRAVPLGTLPYLVGTVVILAGVAVLSTRQPLAALAGLVGPGLAVLGSFGLLWLCGWPFANLLTVVPFLVLVIGVDDAFLLLAAWDAAEGDVPERLGDSLASAGASVTLTSASDVAAFALGAFAGLPAVRLFAIHAALALALDFLLQLSLYPALLALLARRKGRAPKVQPVALAGCRSSFVVSLGDEDDIFKVLSTPRFQLLPTAKGSLSHSVRRMRQRPKPSPRIYMLVRHLYCSRIFQASIFYLYVVQLIGSLVVCSRLSGSFRLSQLYFRGSEAAEAVGGLEAAVLGDAYSVVFAASPVPPLGSRRTRAELLGLLRELEALPEFSFGRSGTHFPLRVALDAMTGDDDEKELEFLERQAPASGSLIRSKAKAALIWSITFRNIRDFERLQVFNEERRRLLKRYSWLGVVSRGPLDVAADSVASTAVQLTSSLGWALLGVSLLLVAFLPDPRALLLLTTSLFSVAAGTLAALGMWGVHLDGVSLISVLMSVGISVDYVSHVCFHFYTDGDKGDDAQERLASTLATAGAPIFQAMASSVLGMAVLVSVDAYVVEVFWKTMVVVNAAGAAHALLLLPVAFLLLHPDRRNPLRSTLSSMKPRRHSQ